jgi:alpha-D-xyloside xylohydrolase
MTILLITLFCQCSSPKIQSYPVKNGIEIKASGFNIRVQFYTEEMARVIKWPSAGTAQKKSLSVIMTEIPKQDIDIDQDKNTVTLTSSKLILKINKKEGQVAYFSKNGRQLLTEAEKPAFEPVVFDDDSGFAVAQKFQLKESEAVYGFGQHQNGYMNYRGKSVVLAQSNTDASVPVMVSTENYAIFWDNYAKTTFTDDVSGAKFQSEMGNNIDYYFITGENTDAVISGYRQLTGKAPMYGKYAYGYWQSKEHYHTQQEILSIAEKYRDLQIPIDNMIQDWNYWGDNSKWSGMIFEKERYPDAKAMCDYLHEMNYHVIISIWPAIGPRTKFFKAMNQQNFLYPPVGWAGFKYYDAFNPAANQLYWKFLRNGLYTKGFDGWWIDSTEPDIVNAMTKESSAYELKKTGSTYLGSWARYLNAFSLAMTTDIHKFWRQETSNRRAYILTRSTFAGQQRNAATTWSGDIGANWQVYKNQITAGLNHCITGIPYWTFDIGAFVLGAYDGVFMYGGKDPAYQELYTRMFQFGAFTPIFRSHGSETPREIWEFGDFSDILIKFDHLRYRLMPYIYSLAWMVTDQDFTIMRPLPMDFNHDRQTYDVDDQFMFGSGMMACPVTEVMYYPPPEASVLIESDCYETAEGVPGLVAKYYKDAEKTKFSKKQIDETIDILWYTGRPDYVTDSTYAIHWEGKLVPKESGSHQFHLLCYDAKRIILEGDTLEMVYTSTEQYTELVELQAGQKYDFVVETENNSTGAARMILRWKTPAMFKKEKEKIDVEKIREVYLPKHEKWYDFWTGKEYNGGQTLTARAAIDIMPLYVPAGTILPMGPFLQYATEKPADPIELRIYPGKDGEFTLYEDENDNYNYESGVYATIDFSWNDEKQTLTIGNRHGNFPGMLKERIFNLVLVSENHGAGVAVTKTIDRTVNYRGEELVIEMK